MMKAQPLTAAGGIGGRPRRATPPPTPFAAWLAASARKPSQIAKELGIAVSSVYNLRNAYYAPGLELANKIAEVSGGAVPTDSWPKPKRPSRAKATAKAAKVKRRAARVRRNHA